MGDNVSDLPKAMEADLFGAADWAVEFLEPLVDIAEGHERDLLAWRLAANRARAAEAAGEASHEVPRPPEDALAPERAALLKGVTRRALTEAAEAFVAAYDEHGGTTVDEVLVALALGNILRTDQRRATEVWETAADELRRRVADGATAWRVSAQSCYHRAMVGYRLVGDEGRAEELAHEAAAFGPTEPRPPRSR